VATGSARAAATTIVQVLLIGRGAGIETRLTYAAAAAAEEKSG